MKKRIKFLYESGGDNGWAALILEGKDLSSILNQAEYTQKLYKYDRECLQEYMDLVQQVTDYSNQLADEKADLEASEAEQEAQQQSLEEMLEQKKAVSDDYENQIADLNDMAAQYNAVLAEQNAKIQQIQEEIAAEEAAKAAEEARKAEEARQAAEAAEAARQAEAARKAEAEAAASSAANNTTTAGNTPSSTGSSTTTTTPSNGGSSYDDSSSSDTGSTGSATGSAIVSYATQFIGNPYVWGGTSLTNGADCSGFIMSVYAHFGYSLPHSSSELRRVGRGVSYAEAQPGDIICYSGHVAIYIGGGAIVHASNERDGIKISSNAAYTTILAVRRVV